MYPICRIEVDGKIVSDEFMYRIASCEVTDKEGVASDTCSIQLNDYPPAEIPRKGAIIKIWMGYRDNLVYMGAFAAEEIEVEMLPYSMSITGKAAEMRGKTKEGRERHWDGKPLKDILGEIAADHGLTPRIDEGIGQTTYEWIGQSGESDIHFVERLAERHGAIFTVKDGKMIFAGKASGKSAAGSDLTPVTVTPDIIQPGSAKVRFSDRTQAKKVKASFIDRGKAKKVELEIESDPDGLADYVLTENYADEAEAEAAAKSVAGAMLRRQLTFSCEIIGNPAARAGAPLTFKNCRDGVDGIPLIIQTATHKYSKSGYTTSLDGESKDGAKEQRAKNKKKKAAGDGSGLRYGPDPDGFADGVVL